MNKKYLIGGGIAIAILGILVYVFYKNAVSKCNDAGKNK
jgi:hypothetical protein